MHIAAVNHSTLVSNADAATMTRAVAWQMRYHVAPAWDRTPASVIWYADEAHVPPGTHIIGIFDDDTQVGDLGWHTESANEAIYGRIFARPVLDNGGNALTAQLSISSVLSHEVIEMFGDAACATWADDGNGELHAVELCDPVEADAYAVSVGHAAVTVSDFVFPEWFDPQARDVDRFDYLGQVVAPFALAPGGYEVYRDATGEQTRFAAVAPAAWRQATKQTPLSRTAKRLRQAGAGG